MCHWKAPLWSTGYCVSLGSEKCYSNTFMFACWEFRFGTLHLKIIVLNFPLLLHPQLQFPSTAPLFPELTYKFFYLFYSAAAVGIFLFACFPSLYLVPQLRPLGKMHTTSGKEKKKKKVRRGVVSDCRCCDNLYHLTLIIHSRAMAIGVASAAAVIPSAVPEHSTVLWVKVWGILGTSAAQSDPKIC